MPLHRPKCSKIDDMSHHLWMTRGPILCFHLALSGVDTCLYLANLTLLYRMEYLFTVINFLSGPLDNLFNLHSPKYHATTQFYVGRQYPTLIGQLQISPHRHLAGIALIHMMLCPPLISISSNGCDLLLPTFPSNAT